MKNNRPSPTLLVRLGLLAVIASSAACAHGPSTFRPEENPSFAVGPAGKSPSHAIDLDANRSASNFSEPTARERVSLERAVVPPVVFGR